MHGVMFVRGQARTSSPPVPWYLSEHPDAKELDVELVSVSIGDVSIGNLWFIHAVFHPPKTVCTVSINLKLTKLVRR